MSGPTLVDWCHNNPTPASTDAAVSALRESGIRAAFFHGSPKPEPKPGEPHFSEVPHPRHEVERLLSGALSDRSGLVTLGLAIPGPHYSTLDVSLQDFRLAREFGLVASMHQGGGPAKTLGGWEKLIEAGLVGPDINIVHGNDLSDDLLHRFVDLGVSFSVTPENEMIQGHGFPITGRLLKFGARPSIGIDLESVLAGDLFGVARVALSTQRALDNADARRTGGGIPATTTIPVREALRWITVEGRACSGVKPRSARSPPGKLADLVVIDADKLDLCPVHDPVSTVVMQTSLANIEAVMINGIWKKKHGRLLTGGLDDKKRQLDALGPAPGPRDRTTTSGIKNDTTKKQHRLDRGRQDGAADGGANREGRPRRDRIRSQRQPAHGRGRTGHLVRPPPQPKQSPASPWSSHRCRMMRRCVRRCLRRRACCRPWRPVRC